MLLIAFGTRPEFLKVRPVILQLRKENISHKILFTGQHPDMITIQSDYLVLPPLPNSDRDAVRLNGIVAHILNETPKIFEEQNISSVMVQGDTTSAFAIALSAFNHRIPIVHLEAGLRTFDLDHPYPEEGNRQMISCIATTHLCPTEMSKNILFKNGAAGIVEVVGNTVLDNLVGVKCRQDKKVLVTLHRRENHMKMREWFQEIENLAHKYFDYEFILPLHPNPAVKKFGYILKKVKVIEPLCYDDLVQYLSSCAFVITDSGGIQEEASFLRKRCLVCREQTERTEGLNNFSLLCENPSLLFQRVEELKELKMEGNCPYGDGRSSARIVKILTSREKSR